MIFINLFNLFAKISLDDKEFQKGVDNASKSGKGLSGALSKIGKGIGTIAGMTVKAVAGASAAVGALAGLSIKQYAEFEQLVGGVETLFKDSSTAVMDYANNAYKTAGLSANQYMETITGFSASLLQSLGGDTKKAAEVGNQAVTDMSDNANKMGTDMSMIQNAYQGFAKANYTMLDNLKLGYGGTKEEMQRLLADAEKISGIKYDISSFADVTEAIHVMQTQLGITGTTAKEASETISGSFNTMKSAWSNMLTAFADDNADFDTVVGNLVESVTTFGDNILPRIKTTLEGIGLFIQEFAWQIPNIIMEILPSVIESGTSVIGALLSAIISAFPQLIEMGINIISTLLTGIQSSLPGIMQGAMQMITVLLQGMVSLLPQILQTGIDIVIQLVLGLAQTLPEIIPIAINAILLLVETLVDNIDNIIDAGIQLLIGLANGLIIALPQLIDKIPIIIDKLLVAVTNNFPKLVEAGIKLAVQLAIGLIKAIPNLLSAIPQIISSILSAFGNYYSNFGQVGLNLVRGIWNGISGAAGWLMDRIAGFASNVVSGIKGFFGIHSPSRLMQDEVGIFLAQGIGVGFDDEMDNVNKDIENSLQYDYNASIDKTKESSSTQGNMIAAIYNLLKTIADNGINLDGREVAKGLAKYQDEFDDYNTRNPLFV